MENYSDRSDQSQPALVLAKQRPGAIAYTGYQPTAPSYGLDMGDESDPGNILEYWHMLKRHKVFIAITALGCMLLGYLVGIPMKPVYRAQTMLEVLSLNQDFLDMKQTSPVSTSDNSDDTSEEQTQARLLQSTALLKRVTTELAPAGPSEKAADLAHPWWQSMLHMGHHTKPTDRQQLVAQATGSLKVRATGRTRLLEVTADSTSPQFASEFLNTLTRDFIRQNMEARMGDTQRTGDWLHREIDDARARLKDSEDALQKYAGESGLIFTDENTNVATEKLQQIQQQLSDATADRIIKQSRFELAKASPPDSLADVLNDPGLRDTSAKLRDLRGQIADLSAVYNPGYQKLRRLQAEQTILQTTFDNNRADILSRIQTDYEEAIRREKLLSTAYDVQVRNVSGQGEKAIQYNILKREVDSNRQLYDLMLQQTKQASVASALRASNVRVVDPADTPTAPVFPNFPLNSAIGFVLGLLASITLVVIGEKADRTLHNPGENQIWTKLPDLGTIPSASADGQKKFYGPLGKPLPQRAKKKPSSFDHENTHKLDAAPMSVGLPSSENAVDLVTWKRETSLIAEAFRSVLTSILVAGDKVNSPHVLVMTSANAAEGKTTVVSNLGISMAEIGQSVLIIDADLRRPRIHKLFNLHNERGLTDVLRIKQTDDEEYLDVIQPTNIQGLDVLPSGSPTNAAANLLYSPNLGKLIKSLRSQYDMILIDTPPMHMADARVAARLADAVIIVARAGQTTRDTLLAATQRLREDRITILGTILNDWNPKHARGGYSYGNGYYNSYANVR